MNSPFLNDRKIFTILLSLLIIVIPLIVMFFWQESLDLSKTIDHSKLGTFGDFVGGVLGSVWSLGGVILFYLALQEQRKDFENNRKALSKQIEALEVQTDEFKLQREELQLSRQVFIEQAKTLKKQQFESTFFSILSLLNNLVIELNKVSPTTNYFKDLRDELKNRMGIQGVSNYHHQDIVVIYRQLFHEKKEELAQYFKVLYRIIKFVAESELTSKEKNQYVKILRSQLSENELLMIFYNSKIRESGKLYTYILEYNLLKHLPLLSKLEFDLQHSPHNFSNLLEFNNELYSQLYAFLKYLQDAIKMDNFTAARASFHLSYDRNDIMAFHALDDNELEFKIIFAPQKTDYFGLTDIQFKEYLVSLFYDFLVISQYHEESKITHHVTCFKSNNTFTYQLLTNYKLTLNHDKE